MLVGLITAPEAQLAKLVGLGRFELPTPRLSSVCSNQLSYRPERYLQERFKEPGLSLGSFKTR